MIRAKGTLNGMPMLMIGLSGENVTRLAAGEDILIDGRELGAEGLILITYGRDEEAIRQRLTASGAVGSQTMVRDGR